MTRISTGMYGGVSAEQRRSERRRRLLDAGLELIATQGWAATSVRRVCEQAGLSSRFFYESFDSLDALAVAVVDEIAADTLGALVEALSPTDQDISDRIRNALAALVRVLAEDPRRARVALIEALGSEPVMRRRLSIMHSVSALLVAEFERNYPPVGETEFVKLAAFGLVGLGAELLIAWTSGDITLTPEELANDLADLVLANIHGALEIAQRRAAVR
jgi:AcrR family transcriptional regulator